MGDRLTAAVRRGLMIEHGSENCRRIGRRRGIGLSSVDPGRRDSESNQFMIADSIKIRYDAVIT